MLFVWRSSPKDFNEIAKALISYLLFAKDSLSYEFDEVEFNLEKNDLKFANIEQLRDPAFSTVVANALLKDKSADIRKHHPGVTPSLLFKEDVGMNLFISSFREKTKLLVSPLLVFFTNNSPQPPTTLVAPQRLHRVFVCRPE
jgi:hypothetical protein